jgi:hypothetical protein
MKHTSIGEDFINLIYGRFGHLKKEANKWTEKENVVRALCGSVNALNAGG